jgi:hypothetical protein
MNPRSWPSLKDQITLARDLFGRRGHHLVAEWLAGEEAHIDDADFAHQFAGQVGLPGVTAGDFNHRHLRMSRGEMLGGIRFYGRNIQRPFVDVFCHGFADLDDLCDVVRSEWSAFAPQFVRLHALPGRVTGPGVVLDTNTYAARYRDMAGVDRGVALEAFTDADEAIAIVTDRYAELAIDAPELRRNVAPATADELRCWHETGQIRAIRVANETVGVLAVAPGAITWIEGDEINEEVVQTAHSGAGYAAAAQAAWAQSVAADPNRLLIGTIDRLNASSRRTAERVGRRRILDAVFVSLDATSG